jgi:hypothetical protein
MPPNEMEYLHKGGDVLTREIIHSDENEYAKRRKGKE